MIREKAIRASDAGHGKEATHGPAWWDKGRQRYEEKTTRAVDAGFREKNGVRRFQIREKRPQSVATVDRRNSSVERRGRI